MLSRMHKFLKTYLAPEEIAASIIFGMVLTAWVSLMAVVYILVGECR